MPTAVAVSSAFRGQITQVAHLVDGDLETAWNSQTGDLTGAWIEIRVPQNATVTSIAMTAGFTRSRSGSDLFDGNHRVSRIRVLRDGEELGTHTLDTDSRELQTLPVQGAGGVYRLEVLGVVAGSRDDWRETCVSELRVMGRAPSSGAQTPEVSIGQLDPSSPTEEAAGTAAPADGDVAQEVRRALLESLGEDEVSELQLTSLGSLDGPLPVVVFEAKAQLSSGMSEELHMVLGIREEAEWAFFSFSLGESSIEPGAESSDVLGGFTELARHFGVLQAEFTITSSSAEFDTCSDCQGRRAEATVRTRYGLVCSPDDAEQYCSITPIEREVVSPSFVIDERGHRGPNPDVETPTPYAMTLAVVSASRVRLTLVSGELDEELSDQLGDLPIQELHSTGRPGERL